MEIYPEREMVVWQEDRAQVEVGSRAMSSPSLIRPVTPNDHSPLRTLDDVSAYMVSLPRTRQWDTVADLMREARKAPTEAALEELTGQVELALFLDLRLDPAGFAAQLAQLLGRIRAPSRDFPDAAPE